MADGTPQAEQSLKYQLQEHMKLELKQHAAVLFTSKIKSLGEVTGDIRDKVARANRLILHIFDLPSEIFLTSVVIMDRYISRKQVKASYMSIIGLSSFHLACSLASNMCQELQIKLPSRNDITPFLGKQFHRSDIDKVKGMISEELSNELTNVVTPLTFKRIFDKVMTALAIKLNLLNTYKNIADHFDIDKAMEIVACDSNTMVFFPREIALCILYIELNRGLMQIKSVGTEEMYITAKKLRNGIGLLQAICKISNDRFLECFSAVNVTLIKYTKSKSIASLKPLSRRISMIETIKKFTLLTPVSESEEIDEM